MTDIDTRTNRTNGEGRAEHGWPSAPYDRALAWLDRNTLLGIGGRELQSELGIGGTGAWILLREHLRAVRSVSDEDRAILGDCLRGFQEPATGLFTEPSLDARLPVRQGDAPLGSPSTRATTAMALQAMKALQRRPAHDLHILDGLEGAGGTATWWESLDWANAALAADDVMSMLLCLVHQAEIERNRGAFGAYHRILDRLEDLQDSRTGFFAVTNNNLPWKSLAASDCLIPFYAYVRRPVQRVARIIDSILSLEESDDALARTRGTAREALAAVQVLTLLSRQSTYRSADVREMLIRTHAAIAQIQQDDGSFQESQSSALESRLFSTPSTAGRPSVTHTLYALWLRVLTMTAIEHAYRDRTGWRDEWHRQDWPGLGYHSSGDALTDHERAALPLWIRPTAYSNVPPAVRGGTPALSVVVPCYNLGLYLHEAVESVLAQTCHDLEIVVVDDGSTDEYTRLLLAHFDRPRTRVIHQENCGLPVARNEGIRQSRGRYICCLDPDDRLRPDLFARACASLDSDPAVGLVSGHFEMFDEQEGAFRFDSCEFPGLLVHNRAIEPAIFRREAWERVGGYCTTFSSSGIEDWDLWITVIELGYRAEIIPETIWEYRIHSGQMSTGMYQPDTWGRLVQELVLRHPGAYREHMVAVIAQHAQRWADLRRWADERGAAAGWWERQARNWERLAGRCDAMFREQQTRIAELEQALQTKADEPEANT